MTQFEINSKLCHNSRLHGTMCQFLLWFDRSSPPISNPEALDPYVTGRHFLSVKQVPTATAIRQSGSVSVTKSLAILQREGFPLLEVSTGGIRTDVTVERTLGALSQSQVSSLGTMLTAISHERDQRSALLDTPEGQIEPESRSDSIQSSEAQAAIDGEGFTVVKRKTKVSHRITYEDPWKIHAARTLAEARGEPLPELLVWPGDGYRLQDPLPPRILGSRWTGSVKNRIRFSQIADVNIKMYVICYHTHWGNTLREMCTDSKDAQCSWARLLKKRLRSLLEGGSDPIWSNRKKAQIYKSDKSRSSKSRSERLIEVLKTVDGMFLQRYLGFPEEDWSWHKYDSFVLGNISYLIGDEFLDGELHDEVVNYTTAYAQLKSHRKLFKDHANRMTLGEIVTPHFLGEMPQWLRQFGPIWAETARAQGHRYDFLVGLLSQTRGCGTPPPLVVLQSKLKFLQTITAPAPPRDANSIAVLRAGIRKVLNDLPDQAFTGLSTKSRITVTTSASWENTRAEGGTIEHISELVHAGSIGVKVPIRCLDTGIVERSENLDTLTTGEYIFWRCLDVVLKSPPEDLKRAFVTVVKEPGKGRTVTKASAALKIVLDLVSRLCAEPLKKGIASSQSGMGKSHHGWNFFLSLMTLEKREELFKVEKRDQREFAEYIERLDIYADLFVSSTDYRTATDYLHHDVAREAGDGWMRKCGIPPILRGIVNMSCYTGRDIYFMGTGPLAQIGEAANDLGQNVRKVRLVRGVLMGDPLTKVVLHMINILSRTIGVEMVKPDFLQHHFDNPTEVAEAVLPLTVEIPTAEADPDTAPRRMRYRGRLYQDT
ncbi:RNA-dependent RNA polymerase [Erysiphe necator associated narnavirus 12]|nr:RNA-dependent RNA polymerase [Erysiphe necator associated narnavirus 12]